ncbi:MAG TPA: D-alanyl-D-alanine carboxypeptidase [Rhodobacteraceae bacterium]|nr:D-alanyl-D-alanine carboxypeptidase [Paracoccaceae bacterium]
MVIDVKKRLGQFVRNGLVLTVIVCLMAVFPLKGISAPYAAFVIDARTGEVLHSRNADTRLHPASLTKMMTLYITFEAIKHGEISLDTKVRISKYAASQPPSKLGLRAGQRIKVRYLIRAAAVKSANDAATALGEAISGSEAAFARRMNRMAKAMGMTRTTFRNMNGLTKSGHLSTARDMTILGRHLFFDYPDYYNLFSRITTDAGGKQVYNTNRRFLSAYRGADGIKTGYTRAAGFNLVASARRGNKRIIATVFGGRSTASRNAKVAELLDLGFRRAPSRARIRRPAVPRYSGGGGKAPAQSTSPTTPAPNYTPGVAGKTIRLVTAVNKSIRPPHRPVTAPPEELLVAMKDDIENALAEAIQTQTPETQPVVAASDTPAERPEPAPAITKAPPPRPAKVILASTSPAEAIPAAQPRPEPIVVTRISTSGGRLWGINVGRYSSQYQAERVLLKTALREMSTLDGALRKVARRKTGFDANFVGMTRETAELACRRLQARDITCTTFGPS